MKRRFCLILRVFLIAFLTGVHFIVLAQDSTELKVISPYDSLVLSDIKAIGNLQTGNLELSMQVRTDYHKLTDVYFDLGGFGSMGITDDKGMKYKIPTNDRLIGTAGINKGYMPVSGVQFGKNKMNWVTYVKDTLHTGESKTLTIRLGKVNKTLSYIKEFHIRCILTLNYMWVGDKTYQAKNIKVDWIKPKNEVPDHPKG
ncbi:MAG TPA: hypothetical protein VNS58_04040 [Puia sp.]|nr:hypothetical protein [Puia sp.]